MKKEKILLLQTCIEKESQDKSSDNGSYPLALSYLDSVLRLNGYEVLSKEYANVSIENCLEELSIVIQDFNPRVVGISVLSMSRVSTYKAIDLIRKINSSIKIILGGVHASVMYKQLLENFEIDAVVIGEGEETIKELIPAIINKKDLKKIKGIAFKENKEVILNENRPLIYNLDLLPIPNHDIFYNPNRTKFCLLSSRGCPNNCTFCCLHHFGRRVFRQRSVDNILKEIKYIINKYPETETIEFSDDTFTLNEKRVLEFCERIISEEIKLKFVCSGRIKPASSRMFEAMEKAGFIEIRFGVESGSEKILKSIKKGITKEEILDTFKLIAPFKKIKVVKMLMVGFPGETWEDIKETVDFVKELQLIVPMDFFYATPLWVYPGTEIYSYMIDKKLISDEYWLSDKSVPHYTGEHSFEEIQKMSTYIAVETAKARGRFFLISLIFSKLINRPFYYMKRFKQEILHIK